AVGLEALAGGCDVLGVDEIEFFEPAIVGVVEALARQLRVIGAGLDLDFRGEPFGPMPPLAALADEVAVLTATCPARGDPAERSLVPPLPLRSEPPAGRSPAPAAAVPCSTEASAAGARDDLGDDGRLRVRVLLHVLPVAGGQLALRRRVQLAVVLVRPEPVAEADHPV